MQQHDVLPDMLHVLNQARSVPDRACAHLRASCIQQLRAPFVCVCVGLDGARQGAQEGTIDHMTRSDPQTFRPTGSTGGFGRRVISRDVLNLAPVDPLAIANHGNEDMSTLAHTFCV
eukprot:3804667-Amphidinium_carterae.2